MLAACTLTRTCPAETSGSATSLSGMLSILSYCSTTTAFMLIPDRFLSGDLARRVGKAKRAHRHERSEGGHGANAPLPTLTIFLLNSPAARGSPRTACAIRA